MTAPQTHSVLLKPPRRNMDPQELYDFLYEMWKRTGEYTSSTPDLEGLEVNATQLNTLIDIRTDDTVQQQINTKESIANLGTMAYQNSNNILVTGGNLTGVTISDSQITIPVNSTSLDLKLSGTLFTESADVGNVGGVEADLSCFTMPANTLAAKGQFLEIVSWGLFAGSGAQKRIRLKLGATVLLDTGGGPTPSNGAWVLKSTVLTNSTTSQKVISNLFSPSTTMIEYAVSVDSTEDLSTVLDLCITGEAPNDNDIVQKGFVLEWFNSGV